MENKLEKLIWELRRIIQTQDLDDSEIDSIYETIDCIDVLINNLEDN